MILSSETVQERYGLSQEQLDILESEASSGVLPGEPGPISVGRPLKFGTTLKMIGFKELPENIAAIDARANELGITRSDYLRQLVKQDLATA